MKFLFLSLALQLVHGGPVRRNGPLPNSPENIAILASGNYAQNIEELSGQFEGDMVLTADQERLLNGPNRIGLINTRYRWPNNTVPYTFDDIFNEFHRDFIVRGMREIERVSCIVFAPRTTEGTYLSIVGNGSGCWSYVGYLGSGRQELNLDPAGCFFRIGTAIHELLHTIGFQHMQSATERDDFVRIMWDNISSGSEHNFNKYSAEQISNFGVEYDVTSVMHYSAGAFSRNGLHTIVPHDISLIDQMGQRVGMSEKDIARLNAMYCQ